MIVDDLTLSTFPIYISTNFWNTNLYIKYIQSSNLMNQYFAISSLAKTLSRCPVTCFEHCTNRCLIYSCQVFGCFCKLACLHLKSWLFEDSPCHLCQHELIHVRIFQKMSMFVCLLSMPSNTEFNTASHSYKQQTEMVLAKVDELDDENCYISFKIPT